MIDGSLLLWAFHEGASADLGDPDIVSISFTVSQLLDDPRTVYRTNEQDFEIVQLLSENRIIEQTVEFPNVER